MVGHSHVVVYLAFSEATVRQDKTSHSHKIIGRLYWVSTRSEICLHNDLLSAIKSLHVELFLVRGHVVDPSVVRKSAGLQDNTVNKLLASSVVLSQHRPDVFFAAKCSVLPLHPCRWSIRALHTIKESVKLLVPSATVTWSTVWWAAGIFHAA